MQNGYCRFFSYDLQKNTRQSLFLNNQAITVSDRSAETNKAIVTAQLVTDVTIFCFFCRLFLIGSLMFTIPLCDLRGVLNGI
ncbi:hypothetical protein C3709_21640 [Lelliottia aquatilis]|jgi:hypothetical protein|uniref:Uncharacterized protein n=1 Tax=Lelliottia aquatilis TaxID=2080838 RepID=A0ABX4ZWG8_9ENTR|nr:hypothetical protein [Lelliottia aquatilis]POZ15244.1 hypothetical protein C3708_22115 [Lelliottia sp. 7254-16]POZ14755.1 hypothetical protein C3Z09_17150 [Lelliottia aquatilis]POZ18983.1 hypothetical protein C3712_21960 [Lelliottia aquatilis]POZ20824.1 hypothetical protein C3711_21865 [Lelliottia aquatilis]